MPPNLILTSVSKTFGKKPAVVDLSFQVEPGEIVGLLGPNGAGKTTTLRMALDLIKPDSGHVEVFGGRLNERHKDRLGYMPEHAGLYADMRLRECLVYLGTLKSLSVRDARQRADLELQRLGLFDDRKKKLHQLSRGMYQKAQIIAATLHDPDLLMVDEPFANLDPINAQVIKETLRGFRARGKSVIMSSHQMHLVEELCDRIVMIHEGRRVLYGPLRDIKQQFAEPAVWLTGRGVFTNLPGVVKTEERPEGWKLHLDGTTTHLHSAVAELLRAIAARPDLWVERFEIALPSLDEVFIRVAGSGNGRDSGIGRDSGDGRDVGPKEAEPPHA
jgi:ABC-2 type transport system ATP-binding protein